MIIFFDLQPTLLAQFSRDLVEEVVSELARSHRKGYHVVVMSRATARWIQDNINLTPRDRSTVEGIRSKFAVLGGIASRAKFLIRIAVADRKLIENDRVIFEVSMDTVRKSLLLDMPTVLVVEDIISDGKFFEFILENSHAIFEMPPPRMELHNGGGERIPDVIAHSLSSGRVVVAVVDTDFAVPKSVPCAKEAKITKVVGEMPSPPFSVFPTPCRESENLLDLSVIDAHKHLRAYPAFEFLTKVKYAEAKTKNYIPRESLLLFFDMKNGIPNVSKLSGFTEEEVDWLSSRVSLGGVDLNIVGVPGFGENIFKRIAEDNRSLSALRASVRSVEWRSAFGSFCEKLLWFVAGGRPYVT